MKEKIYDDKRHTNIYDVRMKPINWNSDKNMTLKAERGVSFEEVLVAISQGLLLNVVEHPNKARYPNQLLFVVRIREYAYLVPLVESDEEIFLKTVIPSRSATRRYISERKNHE